MWVKEINLPHIQGGEGPLYELFSCIFALMRNKDSTSIILAVFYFSSKALYYLSIESKSNIL